MRGQLFQHLRRKDLIQNRVNIDDWEIYLVIGNDRSGALVTIIERKISFTVSMRVDDKSERLVTATTIALL
ncbi:hypothetical protein [Psychromonas sp. CD1]|uniref:hypothetical protein n=1 Tax=Psychromonas sp. CD1 TaxID=1979839 RepID=UPI00117B876D|nr:hypothetical protein [Psychromonas sp. CD1]